MEPKYQGMRRALLLNVSCTHKWHTAVHMTNMFSPFSADAVLNKRTGF